MGYNFHMIGAPFQQNNFLLTLKSMEIGTLSPKNTQESKKKLLSNLCSLHSALRSTLTLLSLSLSHLDVTQTFGIMMFFFLFPPEIVPDPES